MRPNPEPIPGEIVYASRYASLSAALAAAAGKTLRIAAGTFTGLSNLAPASGTIIEGAGETATILQSPASPTSPVFVLDGASNVTLRGFSLAIPSGAASSTGYGIHVKGACADVLVEDVTATGFVNGVRLAGNEGTTGSASAVQVVAIGGSPSGGTYELGLWPIAGGDLQTASGIAHNASASTVQSALEGLAGIGAGNVAVSGSAGGPWTITFQSSLASRWVPLLRASSSLTGGNPTISVTETTRGGDAWLRRVTLRRVRARTSPTSWGIHVDDVDGLILDGCRSEGNHLDGLKLRRYAWNVQVLGGEYSRNGLGYQSASSPAGGDGIDTYAGGEFLRIVGATCDENLGNGIQIKNDDGGTGTNNDSGYGSGKFGLTRKIDLIGVHACRNQGGSGLLLYEAGDTAVNSYSVANVTILGGLYEENGDRGVDITGGRYIVAQGVKARRNRTYGFYVGVNAKYVDLDGCISIANGSAASTGYGAHINGDRVRVRGGIYIGTDDDLITDATDETAIATKYHLVNIAVQATCSYVLIDHPMAPEGTNGSSRSIQVASGVTDVIVNHSGALTPGSSLLYGSPGSTYRKTDATDPADLWWVKYGGAANATGVWRRLVGHGIASKSADYTTTGGDDLILVTAGASDKTVTLVTAAGNKGVAQTIKRMDGAAGNVIVDGNASETIDGATTKTLGSQYALVRVVSDGTNWVITAQAGTVT